MESGYQHNRCNSISQHTVVTIDTRNPPVPGDESATYYSFQLRLSTVGNVSFAVRGG